MWKRWSIKPSTDVALEEDKAKHQTADAGPSDQGPSTTSASEAIAANVNGVAQETASSAPDRTDKTAEGQIPGDVPTAGNSMDNSGKQSTAPINDEKPSSDPPGSVSSSIPLQPETTTLPFTAPSPTKTSSSANDAISPSTPESVANTPTAANTLSVPGSESSNKPNHERRLSFRSFAFIYGSYKGSSISSPTHPSRRQEKFNSGTSSQPKLSRVEKEAFSSAIVLRKLIIGLTPAPSEITTSRKKFKFPTSKSTAAQPLPDIKKVKGQLLDADSANAIISQLRCLPVPDGPSFHVSGRPSSDSFVTHPDAGGAPIHAVCLPCTDEEAEKIYFSRLRTGHTLSTSSPDAKLTGDPTSIGLASLESLVSVLRDLRLVSLLESPDLGFGQPVSDGNSGVLSGSIPSPETLVDGFEQITEQLMSLGFATSKAFAPGHAGIYPPTDRMSVLTYWWGIELVLPEPSVQFLAKAKSISNALLNFLSVLALFNSGVREALPFVRYIANFVDFEWSAIRAQDKGKGVVCAATWVMPAAMVPRPWDFAPRPKASPGSPVSPAPKTSASKGDKGTDGTDAPQELPEGTKPSDPLYPVSPSLPMMPQLLVTPATLPRNSSIPQQQADT